MVMQDLHSFRPRTTTDARLFWQHKGKILAIWFVGVVLTLAYLSLTPRQYQSEAKLFVRLGRESVTLDPTATTGQVVSIAESRDGEVYAVEELLSSRILGELVVDQLGPEVILERNAKPSGSSLRTWLSGLNDYNLNPLRVYSVRDKAIKALQNNLDVSAANKTSIVTISYEAKDPKLAQQVLDALLEHARDEHLRTHRTKGSQEFFVEQSELLKGSLAQLEQELRDLKTTTGLPSLETQRTLQLELIDSLGADLVRAQAEQKSAEAEVAHRREDLSKIPAMVVTERATGLPQTASQTLREKLFDLEVKEHEMATKFTDEYPQLAQIRGQLVSTRRVFEQEEVPEQVTQAVNETYQAAALAVQERQASLSALAARTQSLETSIASVQNEMKKLNDSELKIHRLEREIDLAQINYRKYAENLEQARINQELENAKISSLNVMQPPTISATPVSPNPLVTLMVGFVLSSFAGVGMALVAQHRASPKLAEPGAATNDNEIHSLPSPGGNGIRKSELAPSNPR